MTPLRIGIVGCGRIVERGYVPALSRTTALRLAAVADPVPGRCALAAPGVPAFESVDDLLSAGLDAIVVASPPARHLADASTAAAAGVPSLVEKPPGLDAAQARALAALSPAPWVGFNRRFDHRLGARIAAARLELELRTAGWGAHQPVDDVLLDLGPHLVDLARVLAGAEVDRVRARVVDHDRADLELELGEVRARLVCATGPYAERVEADGRPIYAAGGLLERLRDRVRPASERPLAATLARQLEAFAAAVAGGDPGDLAHARDGVAVMETLDAARRSAAAGGAPEEPRLP